MTLQVAYPYDRRSLEPRPLRAREIVRFLACPRRGAGGDRAAGRPDREVRGAGAVRARSCDAFERTHFSLVGHCEGGKIPEAVFRPHHGWHAATRFKTRRRSSFTCGISGRARELVAPSHVRHLGNGQKQFNGNEGGPRGASVGGLMRFPPSIAGRASRR